MLVIQLYYDILFYYKHNQINILVETMNTGIWFNSGWIRSIKLISMLPSWRIINYNIDLNIYLTRNVKDYGKNNCRDADRVNRKCK